jgi:hypothetical protein
MERPMSSTHEHVLRANDGELPEDVPEDVMARAVRDDERLDQEIADSFPASDPPSDWAGRDPGAAATRRHLPAQS